jgi:hypothetical protein
VTFGVFDVGRWSSQSVEDADNMNEPRQTKQAKSYITSHFSSRRMAVLDQSWRIPGG